MLNRYSGIPVISNFECARSLSVSSGLSVSTPKSRPMVRSNSSATDATRGWPSGHDREIEIPSNTLADARARSRSL